VTDEELKEIEARAVAATKGPWSDSLETLDDTNFYACVRGNGEVLLAVDTGEEAVDGGSKTRALSTQERTNAFFVAHARQDVPKLLTEIKTLKESLKTARAEIGKFRSAKDSTSEDAYKRGVADSGDAVSERDWLRKEYNRLRGELEDAVRTSTSVATTLSIFAGEIQEVRRDLGLVIDSAPCLVAREGELTYECDVRKPCRVCRWRNETKQKLSGF
jgi:hypothetical protein